MRGVVRVAMWACSVSAAFGCTALKSGSDVCGSPGTDCEADAGPSNAGAYNLECQQDAPPSANPAVTFTIPVIAYENGQMPAQLTVCLCRVNTWPSYLDVDAGAVPCNGPISCSMPTPADAGDVLVSIPFPEYTGTPYFYATFEAPGHLPVALWFNKLPPPKAAQAVFLYNIPTAGNLAADVGIDLTVPGTGIVIVTTVDCDGTPMGGIHATLSAAMTVPGKPVVPFILTASGLPVAANTGAVTDMSGQYGFGQVFVQTATATALRSDNTQIGSLNIYARPGWATAAVLSPMRPTTQ